MTLANPEVNNIGYDDGLFISAPLDTPRTQGDRYGDEFSNPESTSPLNAPKPSNVETKVELNDDLTGYTVYEKVGDMDYRPVSELTFQEFAEWKRQQMQREYWDQKTDSLDKRPDDEVKPPLWVFGPKDDPLVEIVPSGNVTLDFGARFQRTENPAIPVNQQKTGGFDFDQQISLNLAGKVGDRIKVNANWDTKAAFDFDNTIKVSFEGKDTDILKELSAGNVSMPLNNTLIKGGQNLFGIKARMQFGRLNLTTLLSNQRGKTKSLVIRNGAQFRDYSLSASDYDDQRHFFLSHEFRERFEQAYKVNYSNPNTGIKITRVEVYRTNLQAKAENQRNLLALTDLGETKVLQNPSINVTSTIPNGLPDDDANQLLQLIKTDSLFRDANQTISAIAPSGLNSGVDYEKVNGAVKLQENEFTFHPDLGYISLNSKLRDNEALAVSYEYTYQGKNYKVGEMMEDYQNFDKSSIIILKLLKPQSININLNTWDLMMKNIYSLPTSNISRDNFQLRVIYRDDLTGIDSPTLQDGGAEVQGVQLVELFGLDRVNPNGVESPDGNFDFLPGATVEERRGRIIFPHPEPFGEYLNDKLNDQIFLQSKYVYTTLYDQTKSIAKRSTEKDKFALTGFYQSTSSTDISLGFNIAEGTVIVQVGSITLSEGSDYTVNYNIGTLKIVNEAILSSGKDIKVTWEETDQFSFRQKSLVGVRADYAINDRFNIGATLMKMSERPLITRVNIGDEPIVNTQVGLDVNFQDESRIITKLVDKLPVIQTKEESNVAIKWEGAMLKPSSSSITGSGGTSYIDDFEGADRAVQLDQSVKNSWMISSTPIQLGDNATPYADAKRRDLGFSNHRAKIAVYTLGDLYGSNNVGERFNLTEDQVNQINGTDPNPYVRPYAIQDIFPERQNPTGNLGTTGIQQTIDFAYYPDLRGPYNYNTNPSEIDAEGKFVKPEDNWGGISRAFNIDNDFQSQNIQFLEFWMLDPFLENSNGELAVKEVLPSDYQNDNFSLTDMGGEMYINIGDISEDFIKDERFGFENGYPDNVDTTIWGLTPNKTYQTESFDSKYDRGQQDIGLDGLSNEQESSFFVNSGVITPEQVNTIFKGDVSSDDFTYWDLDDGNSPILERYMNSLGLENNSPIDNSGGLIRQSKTVPDKEDLNKDQNVNFSDNYWQFKLPLNPNNLNSDNSYIVGETRDDGKPKWYQVRIPVNEQVWNQVGSISGFQNIKFMRIYFTKFKKPIVVRMTQLQFVASQWITADKDALNEIGAQTQGPETDPKFKISTVNISENSAGTTTTSPYQLPPGTERDYDQSTNNGAQRDEQSLKLCVDDLPDGEARAVFKSISTPPLLNYGNLKMFIHAETTDPSVENGEVTAFMRLGTDQFDNYYEIEVPLEFSDITSNDPNVIWPEQNEINMIFDDLVAVKVNRNKQNLPIDQEYEEIKGKYTITVKGTPELSGIKNWMIGVRNPKDGGSSKSFCIWVDELRATDFDQSVGYATVGSFNTNLADLGTFQATTRITTVGYGDIEQKVFEREQANTVQWGVQTNLAMDKFIPVETGVKLPLHLSYDKTTVSPKFDPLNGDVELDQSIASISDDEKRSTYEDKVKYEATVKSIQLQNVHKEKVNPDAKKHIYDIENFSFGIGYTETKKSGMGGNDGFGNNLESYIKQEYNGNAAWGYSPNVKPIEPFKNSKLLKGKYLSLIKDFNVTPIPNSFSVRGDLRRMYAKTVFYQNPRLSDDTYNPIFQKNFTFDRTYNMRWNITKSISITYIATANALIDEPLGDKNGSSTGLSKKEYSDSVWSNIKRFGRLNNYKQDITLTYRLPLNKIPILDWTNADISYKAGYDWRTNIIGLADSNDVEFGNFISNNRDITLNGKLSLDRLYNKNKFLKSINSPPRRKPKPKTPVKKPTDPNADEEEEKEKKDRELKGLKAALKPLLMVKDLNGRYNLSYTTGIPGFLPTPRYVGLDDRENNAPGTAFILGSQDINQFKRAAIANGWYSQSQFLNDPITQNRTESYDLRSTVEPFNDFRIQFSSKYKETSSYSEVYRYNGTGYETFNPLVRGNINMSYVFIRTSFSAENGDNLSEVFQDFEGNRIVVRDRLNAESDSPGTYDDNSQDVLIPAFRSAYTGEDINKAKLSAAPKIPLPNWQITYAGLSKWKPIKKMFSSFSITHGYTGAYEIGGYTSSLEYNEFDPASRVNQRRGNLTTNDEGIYISPFVISGVAITERFSPLIGFNVRTKSRINLRFDYNISRMLDLDMANLQVTEQNSKDVVIGIGYTKRGMNLPFLRNREGQQIVLKNNVNMKMDLSIRDTRTIQRNIESDNVVTAGNINFQLRPNVSYEINQRVNLQFFFERTVNEPRISSSFKRSTTMFGIKLRFSLT